MANELEKDLNQETKPQKLGNALIRVWDDGIVDARYVEINKDGRGPALKVPLDGKEDFIASMRTVVLSALDGLVLPEYSNYAVDASSQKPVLVGTASLDVYSDKRVISVFTEIDRSAERGAPRKNSTLTEVEWKQIMSQYVGSACSELKLTINAVQSSQAHEESETTSVSDTDANLSYSVT
jgi:hypothetical protein